MAPIPDLLPLPLRVVAGAAAEHLILRHNQTGLLRPPAAVPVSVDKEPKHILPVNDRNPLKVHSL